MIAKDLTCYRRANVSKGTSVYQDYRFKAVMVLEKRLVERTLWIAATRMWARLTFDYPVSTSRLNTIINTYRLWYVPYLRANLSKVTGEYQDYRFMTVTIDEKRVVVDYFLKSAFLSHTYVSVAGHTQSLSQQEYSIFI